MDILKISKYSAVGFLGILILHHLINTDIDPSWQPISMYTLGKFGWLMNIAFLLLGVSFFALGVYLFNSLRTLGAKIGGGFLILAALGNFLAGMFNPDPIDTLPEQMTISGSIHAGAAGLLGFFIIATIFVSFQFLRQNNLRPFKGSVLVVTGLVIIAEIALVAAMGTYLSQTNGMLTPETPIGGFGRIVIVACCIWVITTANALRKGPDQSEL